MKLLLIEDDPEMTDALRTALSQHGIVLDAVGDLAMAREAIAMADYDIVLIDRQLPDGDGSTFLADLRRAGSNTRSIIISALRSTDERISGLNDGADDYLPKPFEIPADCQNERGAEAGAHNQPVRPVGRKCHL